MWLLLLLLLLLLCKALNHVHSANAPLLLCICQPKEASAGSHMAAFPLQRWLLTQETVNHAEMELSARRLFARRGDNEGGALTVTEHRVRLPSERPAKLR